jgi:hypothetical protein
MRVIVTLVAAVSTSTGSDGQGMETLVERCAGLDVHKVASQVRWKSEADVGS